MQLAGRRCGSFAGKQFHLSLSKDYFSHASIHPAVFLQGVKRLLCVKFTYFHSKFRRKQKSYHKGGGGIFSPVCPAGRGFASPSPPLSESFARNYFRKSTLGIPPVPDNGNGYRGKCTMNGKRVIFKSSTAGGGSKAVLKELFSSLFEGGPKGGRKGKPPARTGRKVGVQSKQSAVDSQKSAVKNKNYFLSIGRLNA